VIFVDTAGLRESGDEIEVEGIRRSRQMLADAELILHVLDAAEPLSPATRNISPSLPAKRESLFATKPICPAGWIWRLVRPL